MPAHSSTPERARDRIPEIVDLVVRRFPRIPDSGSRCGHETLTRALEASRATLAIYIFWRYLLPVDEALLRLLDFHGRRYWLVNGWSIRFYIVESPVSTERPHGIRYSLTLHDVDGTRLLGFDNAMGRTRRMTSDHWHPFRRTEAHEPYEFINTDRLLADFFAAVDDACQRAGVPPEYVPEDTELDVEEEDDGPQADC